MRTEDTYHQQSESSLIVDGHLSSDLVVEMMDNLPLEKVVAILNGNRDVQETKHAIFSPLRKIPERRGILKIVIIDGHPSDTEDFDGGLIAQLEDAEVVQLMATRGEKGYPPVSEEKTIEKRNKEAKASSLILRTKIDYLTDGKGRPFHDGDLLDDLPALTESIERQLVMLQPDVVIIHSSDEYDHGDHVAASITTKRAAQNLSKKKGYKKPMILERDSEFAFPSAEQSMFDKINNAKRLWLGLRRGKGQEYPKKPQRKNPDLLVEFTKVRNLQTKALHYHQTQIMEAPGNEKEGKTKDYVKRNPARSIVRGDLLSQNGEKHWAHAYKRTFIPNTTSSENRLAAHLPPNTMFENRSPKRVLKNLVRSASSILRRRSY